MFDIFGKSTLNSDELAVARLIAEALAAFAKNEGLDGKFVLKRLDIHRSKREQSGIHLIDYAVNGYLVLGKTMVRFRTALAGLPGEDPKFNYSAIYLLHSGQNQFGCITPIRYQEGRRKGDYGTGNASVGTWFSSDPVEFHHYKRQGEERLCFMDAITQFGKTKA